MKRIIISFDKFSDVNFRKKAEFIYNSMSSKTVFASLSSDLVIMKAALDKYSDDLRAAETRERNAIVQKNKSRQELTVILRQLALRVMNIAGGDEIILVSSGYSLSKRREPRYITSPGNVTLLPGLSSGEMISMIKTMMGASSYVHQLATEYPTELTVWASYTSSASKFLFTNLTPGKQYWVRVAVVGSRNQIAYSTVATWFAQ